MCSQTWESVLFEIYCLFESPSIFHTADSDSRVLGGSLRVFKSQKLSGHLMPLVLESHWVVREEHIFEEQCKGGSTMDSFQLDPSVGHPLGWNEQSHFLCSDWLANQVQAKSSPVWGPELQEDHEDAQGHVPSLLPTLCGTDLFLASFVCSQLPMLFQAREVVY